VSKHELSAWWRLALSAMYGLYLCRLLFFTEEVIADDGWEGIRGTLNFLLVIILLLDAYLRRRKGIAEDERDRAISGIASRDALVALGILVALTPTITGGGVLAKDAEIVLEVAWFDFYVFACIAFAVCVEAAVTVFHHWRDRRGSSVVADQ
jgi:uncharacterized membrane protein